LFPGYLFSRFSFTNRLPILTIPGVVNIVSLGKEPTPVDEEEIRSLLVICGSQLPAQPWPFLRRGQRVVIERGALQGAEGLLVDDRKAYRLVVSITLLQRSVAVEIDRDWVRPILCVDPGRSRAASA
jgi:transcription antitermination factor NusG